MDGTRETLSKAVVAAIIAVVVVVAGGVVTLAGWQAGWWFQAQNTNRTDRVTQQGYANQTALQAQVQNEFSEVTSLQADEKQHPADVSFDQPQILSEAGKICAQLPQFAPGYSTDPQWRSWEHANCADGALSATSALRK
jgi:hypothetical protein